MKIYVVTQGEYSDYHIIGVFLDKAKADALAAHNKSHYDTMTVEEYDTADTPWEQMTKAGGLPFHVYIDIESGTVRSVELKTHMLFEPTDNIRTTEQLDYTGKVLFINNIMARDEQHAVKIANERRIAYKLNNQATQQH